MLNRRFLSIISSVISFSAVAPAYSIKETNVFNHRFLEFDKRDKSFKKYFDQYADLPRFRYENHIYGYPNFVDAKPDFENFKDNKLIMIYDKSGRYSIGYLLEFENGGKECTVHDIRGLLNQYSIQSLKEIDLSIFLFPFYYYENLNVLTIEGKDPYSLSLIRPRFCKEDKKRLVNIGFIPDRSAFGFANGDLFACRKNISKCLHQLINGGRT